VPTDAIRDTIELAKQHEHQHGYMAALLNNYVQDNNLRVMPDSEHNLSDRLMAFIHCYINYVPDFIDSARAITHEACIQEHSEPFLSLAEDYFLKPPEIINKLYGLIELMDEAYLAHRLLEEVNDRFMAKTTIPLTPIDMTMSNLLVHSLIGEPFANELDEAVQFTAERNFIKQHVYENPDFKAYVSKVKTDHSQQSDWPCLMEKLSLNLHLTGL
jgi:hypothetical protein